MRIRYAAILDAGSSGTRIYIYSWEHYNKGDLTPPAIKLIYTENISPGISKISTTNESNIGKDIKKNLEPLLVRARQFLGPDTLTRTVPLFFLATAGLRYLLPVDKKKLLLENLRKYISTCGFRKGECRVISGAEEAIYGWVAANYSLGHFSGYGQERDSTVGYLEMGGASMQIAFRPTKEEMESYVVKNMAPAELAAIRGISNAIDTRRITDLKNSRFSATGIPVACSPTWTKMIGFFYRAGNADKNAFEAMVTVVKRVWAIPIMSHADYELRYRLIAGYNATDDAGVRTGIVGEAWAMMTPKWVPMTDAETGEWTRLVGLYSASLDPEDQLAIVPFTTEISQGRVITEEQERELLDWHAAANNPKLAKIVVAGKPFFVYRKSFPLGGDKLWGGHESSLKSKGVATNIAAGRDADAEVVVPDNCRPHGFRQVGIPGATFVTVEGGEGQLGACEQAAYFQIRNAMLPPRKLVATVTYPAIPPAANWNTTRNYGHQGRICPAIHPATCGGDNCAAPQVGIDVGVCAGPCKCTMDQCVSAIYLLHKGPTINNSARQFVGGARFYYTTRAIFGTDRHGNPKKKAYNYSDFLEEMSTTFAKEWETLQTEMSQINPQYLPSAWFGGALVNVAVNHCFRISQDERHGEIKFRPYHGTKEDELTWTLGRIVLWATGDEDIVDTTVSETQKALDLYREGRMLDDGDEAEITGLEGNDSDS